jgi:hypothetical protein
LSQPESPPEHIEERAGSPEPSDATVERRAKEMLHGGDGHEITSSGDRPEQTAEQAARRILEESEARTLDTASGDPEDEGAIHRTSTETASRGEP